MYSKNAAVPFMLTTVQGKSVTCEYILKEKLKHEENHKWKLQRGCLLSSAKKKSMHNILIHKVVSTCLCLYEIITKDDGRI